MNAVRALLVLAVVGGCESGDKRKTGAATSATSAADLAPLRPALEAAPAAGSSPPDDATVEPIGFDWGPPCRVPAVQEVDDDGRTARLAFDVVLERAVDTGLVVRLDNMRALTNPALDNALLALDGAIPAIKVNDIGESEGAIDIDKSIDAILALAPSGETKPKLERLFRSPQMRAVLEQKAGETWNAWVGGFTGMDIAPNAVRRDTIDLPSAIGTFKDVKIVVTHHGAVRDAPALSLLSIEQTIEGPELGAMIVGMMKDVMPAGTAPTFEHAKKTDTITVAIDPKLGRPHRARHVVAIELADRRKRKTRDTAFDWSRAKGCTVSHDAPDARQ